MFYQQGDVLLKVIDSIPEGASKKAPAGRGLVLAEGEVTGHFHAVPMAELDGSVSLLEKDDKLYVSAEKEFHVEHDEHHTQTIPAGTYVVDIVQEYDHYEEEVNKVRD